MMIRGLRRCAWRTSMSLRVVVAKPIGSGTGGMFQAVPAPDPMGFPRFSTTSSLHATESNRQRLLARTKSSLRRPLRQRHLYVLGLLAAHHRQVEQITRL